MYAIRSYYVAFDAWEGGIISHINDLAKTAGIEIGDSIQTAVAKISPKINSASKNVDSEVSVSEPEGRIELKVQSQTQITGKNITVTDSITFLNERNAGDIVVCGSHGGVSAGHYAQKHHLKAVFFNDAGIGKNNAGTRITSYNVCYTKLLRNGKANLHFFLM